MILEPINDNIVIKMPIQEKEIKTASGIYVGTNSGQSKPDRGEVVAVGKGRITADGKLIELNVKPGDQVIYNRFAGTEITQGDEKFLIIKENDILVKVK
jgi:chaperonin GroES